MILGRQLYRQPFGTFRLPLESPLQLGRPYHPGSCLPPETAGGSHREKMGRSGKGSDVGKLEGAGRDLEEGTAGKSALLIQWTNKAARSSITITHLGLSGPRLTKGLGVVTTTLTPPFQVPGSSNEMPTPQLLTYTSNMRRHNC